MHVDNILPSLWFVLTVLSQQAEYGVTVLDAHHCYRLLTDNLEILNLYS